MALFVEFEEAGEDFVAEVVGPAESPGFLLFLYVVLADMHDGRPLGEHHGGPVRLVVPKLFAWKSAK